MAWKRFAGNKYSNKKIERDGYSFASKLEAAVYQELKLLQTSGRIKILQTQASVYLTDARILYKPDFKIMDLENGKECHVEAKGFKTPEWNLKKRLWKFYGPSPLMIYEGSWQRPRITETIIPVIKLPRPDVEAETDESLN